MPLLVTYRRIKTIENSKTIFQKVVVVIYERRSHLEVLL